MTRTALEGHFAYRLDHSPILGIASPQRTQCEYVNVASFFACIDRGLERNCSFAVLHDVRGIPPVDDQRRRLFQELLEPRRARIERLVVGYAAVCGSPLERGLVTAFSWFIRLSLPIRIYTSEAEASSWLLTRYELARRARPLASSPATLE